MNVASALDPAVTDFCKLLRSLGPGDAARPDELLLAFPCGRTPHPNETMARLASFFQPV